MLISHYKSQICSNFKNHRGADYAEFSAYSNCCLTYSFYSSHPIRQGAPSITAFPLFLRPPARLRERRRTNGPLFGCDCHAGRGGERKKGEYGSWLSPGFDSINNKLTSVRARKEPRHFFWFYVREETSQPRRINAVKCQRGNSSMRVN